MVNHYPLSPFYLHVCLTYRKFKLIPLKKGLFSHFYKVAQKLCLRPRTSFFRKCS